jgi:hypothetical protein
MFFSGLRAEYTLLNVDIKLESINYIYLLASKLSQEVWGIIPFVALLKSLSTFALLLL